jgi:hypothetical protein
MAAKILARIALLILSASAATTINFSPYYPSLIAFVVNSPYSEYNLPQQDFTVSNPQSLAMAAQQQILSLSDSPATNFATGAAAVADTTTGPTTNSAVGVAKTKPITGATTTKSTIGAATTEPTTGAEKKSLQQVQQYQPVQYIQ